MMVQIFTYKSVVLDPPANSFDEAEDRVFKQQTEPTIKDSLQVADQAQPPLNGEVGG